MNTHVIRSALLLLAAGVIAPAFAQGQPQVIDVPLSRPGEPVTLDISIISAHIEVIGEDRQDARFEVSVVEGSRKIITPSGTQSLDAGAYAFEVEEKDNHLQVDTSWRTNQVKIVARIPRRADLKLATVNDGVIEVSGITGDLELKNTNGPITATGITGTVLAESVNDDIEIHFAGLDGAGAMSMRTVNGDLVLGLPDNAGAELHIDSSDGDIVSDFEVEVMPSKPVVSREDNRGSVEVRVESVIIARVGGGGPVFKLRTLNGDVRIVRAGRARD